MKNIYDIVVDLLKSNERYLSEDGNLLKANVYSDAMTMDKELIETLLKNEDTRKKFFVEINNNYVFDKQGFAWFVEEKEFLPDSYTKYYNKIGLTVNGKFINQNNDVVIDFPFKDCVLEGGQTKEDQKRDEIFFNEMIASDEISRMLSPKVFTNIKRYLPGRSENTIEYRDDDNLIIKGNNIIALSCILRKYEGKIKCIYIDPPYNTGSDSFQYNDNFNHSSWLVFMKNRLQLAYKLLRDDGSIFVQCDDFEDSYLKVLMDEIFGRTNYRNKITWKRRGGSANPKNRLNNVTDYILWYSKSDNMDYTPIFSLDDENTQKYIEERFKFIDENGRRYMKSPLQSPNPRPNLMYEYKGYKVPAKGWSISKEIMEKWDAEGRLCFPEDKNQNINRKIFLDEYKGQPISSLWTDIYVINPMSKEAIDFVGQKPEALIKRLLEMCTKEGELVLDFHLGTGTTATTALKMKRKFIGIEQMDYINTITLKRLEDVLNGEQSGISQDVNWNGGGSFVYCELKENGQILINEILEANENNIDEIKEKIINDDRIISYITKNEIKKADEEFNNLSLEEKKKSLITLIDKNKLYINYSDIDDMNYNVTEEEKSFTKSFYEGV